MMTERANKLKGRLSLSKSKKRGNVKAGTSASPAATTIPITSFFNSQAPTKLACPLCGQFVPRFKINEHIDLQCQNFERSDSDAFSANNSVGPSIQLSPRRNPPKSPELHPNKEKEKVKKTNTSPYFKKNNYQQPPRDKNNKSVVRMLELGSLSSKLSRKCQKVPERVQATTYAERDCETLGSSQKENLLSQSLEDEKDYVTVVDNTTTSINTATAADDPTCSNRGQDPECNTSKSVSAKMVATPNLPSSSSKLSPKPSKRKKETSTGMVSDFRKKAKYEGSSRKPEDGSSRGSTADMPNGGKPQTEVHTPITACQSSLTSEEAHEKSPSATNNDLMADSGDEKATSGQTVEGSQPQHLPYYLRNFRTVLQAVLENEDDRVLFDQDDMSLVHAFEKLSVMGQKLYVRLFQRKLKWLQVNKLGYEEISSDLGPVTQKLVEGGFLESESDLQDLGEALDLLPAPELKALGKTFHLGNSGTQKQQLLEGLLRLSKQKSLFSITPAQNNIGAVILKRAKQLAGSCVRLRRGPRAVFSRILLLFSLTDTMDDEEMAAGGQNQLFTILLVNSGRLAFPEYIVLRKAKLFQDREDLIRYEASMRALQEVASAVQGGQWEEAMELYSAAKSAWQELRKNHDLSHQEELPVFLRSFTTGWAYTRILSRGVEILQRLRRYEEAIEELRSLLSQSVYCPDSRGRWWDRLALNLHQHLKKPEQAICSIRDGLSDPLVRTGHKLSLYQRAVRMKESVSLKKYHKQLQDLPSVHVQDVKHVTIRGQLFPHEGGMGKSVFLIPMNEEGGESANATMIGSVEDLCLAHYRQQGFDQGMQDPWRGINFLNTICPSNVGHHIYGGYSRLFQKSIPSLQQAQSLVSCLGGAFLGGVIARMSKDYRHCRAGMPDLVVWNTSNNCYKLVEVKGPSDRLSQKQQIWLDELQKLGADVEVCHVVATGARGACLE